MARDPHLLTNLLLAVVIVLLLLALAIPSAAPIPSGPPAPPATARVADDAGIADLVAKVKLLIEAPPLPATGPGGAAAEDEVVVRIPGKLARDLGITAADVRALVEGLAAVAKKAGSDRPAANETAAISTSRNCCSAQAQFQACAKADVDRDGTGEFGGFRELSGGGEIRGSAEAGKLNPPVLSGAFRTPSDKGFVTRSGYNYVIYLPDASGDGVAVDAAGYDRVSPDLAETHWCMYAWPVDRQAGSRTFMVNQNGDVLATDAEEYVGDNAPLPGAAFESGGRFSITGKPAIGREGQDGHAWRQAN